MELTSINPGEASLMARSTSTLQKKLLTQFAFVKPSPISCYNLLFKKDFWLTQVFFSIMIQLLQIELDICFVPPSGLSLVGNNFPFFLLPFLNSGLHPQHFLRLAFHR